MTKINKSKITKNKSKKKNIKKIRKTKRNSIVKRTKNKKVLVSGFPCSISNRVYLIGETHGYDILSEIKDICKKYPDFKFHLFTEMSLSHDISSNKNITIIPEILYVEGRPEVNIRNVMFFIINTFVYMKVYLQALENGLDLSKNLNTVTGVPIMLDDVEDYFGTALHHRMDKKFFGTKYRELYNNLEYFFKTYKRKDLRQLKIYFSNIIKICSREKIFEPILKLNKEYINKDDNKQNLINFNGKYDLVFDRPRVSRKDNIIQGWSFLARDMYHSNLIEMYFNSLPTRIQEKSVIIIHKGFIHFSTDVFKYSERSFFVEGIKRKDKDEINRKIQNIISRF